MTTNAEILAKADRIEELVREKLWDELWRPQEVIVPMPGDTVPIIPVYIDPATIEPIVDSVAVTIRPAFAWFTEPDPNRVAQMLDSLRYITGSFDTPLEDPAIGYLDQVQSHTSDWYGSAADAFNTNFLTPFPAVRHNQIALIAELAQVLEGYQTLLNESRTKIMEIADLIIAALEALPAQTSSVVMFSIAALVVGVLAAAYSGGASLTIPLAILGGGYSLAADAAGEASIQGGNVAAVLTSMTDAIALLKQDMANAEQILVEVLAYDAGLLADAQAQADRRELNPFVSMRPNVIDVLSGTDVDYELSTGR